MPALQPVRKSRKQGVHVYLPPEQMQKMRELKSKEGMSYGELIQSLMRFYEDNR